jgi:hypothetical protein
MNPSWNSKVFLGHLKRVLVLQLIAPIVAKNTFFDPQKGFR